MAPNWTSRSKKEGDRRYTVDQLKELVALVKHYLIFDRHILILKRASASGTLDDVNYFPWTTLKEGSYYLGNVHPLIEKYIEYNPDEIYDKNMESVIDAMKALGFHPSYNTIGFNDEAYGNDIEAFVSTGKGTMYYKLLHSKYKKDIRFFVEFVEREIDIPIRKFLQSIEDQLASRNVHDYKI